MKTFKNIKELNYNDLSFFTGKSVGDCKWDIAAILGIEPDFKKETVKVGINDTIQVSQWDFTMRSNSKLDGLSKFEYLCNYYNKGCDMNTLKKFSETATYINALAFTGKNKILNEILNPEQLLKLQKSWLYSKVYSPRYFDPKALKFIRSNDWAIEYLESKGVDVQAKMPDELEAA